MSGRGRDGGEAPEPMAGEDLVSLLYGELEPGEAERTGARVAADPTLSARLGEMRRVRDLFAALEDEEPPARLTAQLMAEAARAAPQQRRAATPAGAGFWARLVSWMQPLVQRPALAAAASLVLVAGVAGVLYMKKGEELTSTAPPAAEPDRAIEGSATGAVADPVATPPPATAAPEAPADSTGTAEADDEAAPEPAKEEPARTDSKASGKRRKLSKSADADRNAYDTTAAKPKPAVKSGTVYGLSEQEMVPNEPAGADSGGAVGGAPGDGKAEAPAPQAPQPAPSTAPAPEQQQDKAAPRPNVRDLHRRAIDAALDNRCSEVRTLAGQVRAADAGFYGKTFAPDTRLQKCLASPQKTAPAKKPGK